MGILSMFGAKKNLPQASAVGTAKGSASPALGSGIYAVTTDMNSFLASDEKAWLTYLRQAVRTYRRPGLSMCDERELWYAARAQQRAAEKAS